MKAAQQPDGTQRREIKFRCWYNGKMIYRNGYNSFFEFSITPEGVVFIHGEAGKANGEDRNAILLQFTGLKDKNGKDVYEGDIVLLPADQKCTISWDNNGFIATAIESERKKDYPRQYLYFTVKEVISNIYENESGT